MRPMSCRTRQQQTTIDLFNIAIIYNKREQADEGGGIREVHERARKKQKTEGGGSTHGKCRKSYSVYAFFLRSVF